MNYFDDMIEELCIPIFMKLDDPGTNSTTVTQDIWNQSQFDQCSENAMRFGNPV